MCQQQQRVLHWLAVQTWVCCGPHLHSQQCHQQQARFQHTTSRARNVPDYYKILDVPPNATASAVRAAYVERSKKLHPDLNRTVDPKASHEKFTELQEAYSVLRDPNKRREYDVRMMVHRSPSSGSDNMGFRAGSGPGFYYDSTNNMASSRRARRQAAARNNPHSSDFSSSSFDSQQQGDDQRGFYYSYKSAFYRDFPGGSRRTYYYRSNGSGAFDDSQFNEWRNAGRGGGYNADYNEHFRRRMEKAHRVWRSVMRTMFCIGLVFFSFGMFNSAYSRDQAAKKQLYNSVRYQRALAENRNNGDNSQPLNPDDVFEALHHRRATTFDERMKAVEYFSRMADLQAQQQQQQQNRQDAGATYTAEPQQQHAPQNVDSATSLTDAAFDGLDVHNRS